MPDEADYQAAYDQLLQLIESRKYAEENFNFPPYSTYPTSWSFCDVYGYSLMDYAIKIGELDRVKKLVEEMGYPANYDGCIKTALLYGYLDVAQYFYDKGANCSAINLKDIKEAACRQWFIKLIQQALFNSAKAGHSLFVKNDNRICGNLADKDDKRNLLDRAAEIGDVNFLTKYTAAPLSSVENKIFFQCFSSLLKCAISNDQLVVVKALDKNRVKFSVFRYDYSPLSLAVDSNATKCAEFFIKSGHDIEFLNSQKQTPLMVAILNDNEKMINLILKAKPNVVHRDMHGNNILHFVVKNSNSDVLASLICNERIKPLLNEENIFGMKPIDYAAEDNKTRMISLINMVSPGITPNQSASKYIPINQSVIMDKMLYYLKINYRNLDFFSVSGFCNGFEFLRDFYVSEGRGEYFYNTLRLISSWNGEIEFLKESFSDDMPQRKYYTSLENLLEQWINDLVWFQQSTLKDIFPSNQATITKQANRKFHHEIISQNPTSKIPKLVSKTHENLTPEEFSENLLIWSKMSRDCRLELKGSGHAVSVCKVDDKFSYYDPNFTRETRLFDNIIELTNVILDTKIIRHGKLDLNSNRFDCEMYGFYYYSPNIEKQFSTYRFFSPDELPKSCADVAAYQIKSANHYNQLHVAVLSGSIINAEEILKLGFCNLTETTTHSKTALDLALTSLNMQMVNLILSYYPQDTLIDVQLFLSTYQVDKDFTLNVIEIHKNRINFLPLFMYALNNPDMDFARILENLFIQKLVTLDMLQQESLVNEAIKKGNVDMVKLLLKHGASLVDVGTVSVKLTPFHAVVTSHSRKILSFIFDHLKDINELDSSGHALIHYLPYVRAHFTFFLNNLLRDDLNFNQKTADGKSIVDIMLGAKLGNPNYIVDFFEVALEHFNLENKQKVIKFMVNSLYSDSQVFNTFILMDSFSKDLLELVYNGKTLLHHAVLAGNKNAVEMLLNVKADLYIKDENGLTALDLLRDSKNPDFQKLFERFERSSGNKLQ